jgi:hypothetical protein
MLMEFKELPHRELSKEERISQTKKVDIDQDLIFQFFECWTFIDDWYFYFEFSVCWRLEKQ